MNKFVFDQLLEVLKLLRDEGFTIGEAVNEKEQTIPFTYQGDNEALKASVEKAFEIYKHSTVIGNIDGQEYVVCYYTMEIGTFTFLFDINLSIMFDENEFYHTLEAI